MVVRCLLRFVSLLGILTASVRILSYLSKTHHLFKRFKLVGQVASLHCYPVAGCKGVMSRHASCTPAGIKIVGICDKQFVIARKTDKDFALSTPRDMMKEFFVDRMQAIDAFSDGLDLILSAPDRDNLVVPFSVFKMSLPIPDIIPKTSSLIQLWRASNAMVAENAGDLPHLWLKEYLLVDEVYLYRVLDQIICCSPGRASFGNYVVAVRESIDYANKQVKPIPPMLINYFRPNIIINGCDPLDEQRWSYIKIGDVYLQVTCVDSRVTTTKRVLAENWKPTYESTPELPNGVKVVQGTNFTACMGVNAVVVRTGDIAVGDPVFAAY